MMRVLLTLMMFFSFVFSNTVERYVKELDTLDSNQTLALILAYWSGRKSGFELTLTAIVWKESSFGKHLANSRDGKYGSFGIAQILLDTAMSRLNLKGQSNRKKLKERLLTDNVFNLKMATQELNYWKTQHHLKANKKYWLTLTIASYNAGWRGIYNPKGKKYAKDVLLRIKALKKWFKKTDQFKYVPTKEHMKDIKRDLKSRNII